MVHKQASGIDGIILSRVSVGQAVFARKRGELHRDYCVRLPPGLYIASTHMGARKEVFISATSADLASYRQVAKEAVLTLGAHPIEEKDFPTDYRELQALLPRRLDPCDAVIHLVGFYYGGEPNVPPDTPRRSWTQWEYYRATLGAPPKPVYR